MTRLSLSATQTGYWIRRMIVEPRQTRFDCGRFKLSRHHAGRHSGVVNVDDDREIGVERVTDNHICCSRFAMQARHRSEGDGCRRTLEKIHSRMSAEMGRGP